MKMMKASYAASVCGGKLIGEDVSFCGVSRDNREVKGGEMFVAIRGENFDGHSFAAKAVENGAVALLVSEKIEGTSATQIVVRDTVTALGEIAKSYLQTLPAKRVCITGSVGKTTTKEMCATVLAESFATHKTQGNFNNNIGLPLTVFGMDETYEAAVLEIGTNHFGEILPLAKIANPDAAVITAIGESHLEAFGSKEGVLREKIEILKGLKEDGTAILNGDDPLLWGMRDKITHKTVWFGIENQECDVLVNVIENGAYEARFEVKESDVIFTLPCGGIHNIRDAASAIAVGRVFGMEDSAIARGLSKFRNTGMRQDVIEIGGCTLIRDCYNANPDSMRASISLLRDLKCKGKKLCIMGDMLELGENAGELHRQVGAFAAECADIVMVTGKFAESYRGGAGEKVCVFPDKQELAKALSEQMSEGDAILVKGSYGTKMWQVIESLQEERE